MGKLAVGTLRGVLAVLLVGTLFVQVVMVPLIAIDLTEFGRDLAIVRVPIVVLTILGVVTVQITLFCVWRLLTMVRRGIVFSPAAFRYVNVVIAAITAAALLTFGLAVVLAPGDTVPPGMVLLVCGSAVMIAAVALIVLVLRMLLAQAVERDAEAHHLRTELENVI